MVVFTRVPNNRVRYKEAILFCEIVGVFCVEGFSRLYVCAHYTERAKDRKKIVGSQWLYFVVFGTPPIPPKASNSNKTTENKRLPLFRASFLHRKEVRLLEHCGAVRQSVTDVSRVTVENRPKSSKYRPKRIKMGNK